MRLVLLLLMATCLTGCVPQFPYYCEDANAPICYLQRRPIFAPREKPTSDPKPERRDGERPDDAPRSPSVAYPCSESCGKLTVEVWLLYRRHSAMLAEVF